MIVCCFNLFLSLLVYNWYSKCFIVYLPPSWLKFMDILVFEFLPIKLISYPRMKYKQNVSIGAFISWKLVKLVKAERAVQILKYAGLAPTTALSMSCLGRKRALERCIRCLHFIEALDTRVS